MNWKSTTAPLWQIVRSFILRARWVRENLIGQISRSALLTRRLPLSFASLFGSLVATAYFFSNDYNWRVDVISKLTSPRDNPQGFWLASLGVLAAMLLAAPFARYVAERLRATMPRTARFAGLAFATAFLVMSFSMMVQFVEPVLGLRKLHTYLAQTSAGFFISGMLCCSVCALKDRLRFLGGKGSLPAGLSSFWVSITLLPVLALGILLALLVVGGNAEEFRQSFRHTPLWHLAFWEWIGVMVAFTFLVGSVSLLPVSVGDRRWQPEELQRVAEVVET